MIVNKLIKSNRSFIKRKYHLKDITCANNLCFPEIWGMFGSILFNGSYFDRGSNPRHPVPLKSSLSQVSWAKQIWANRGKIWPGPLFLHLQLQINKPLVAEPSIRRPGQGFRKFPKRSFILYLKQKSIKSWKWLVMRIWLQKLF